MKAKIVQIGNSRGIRIPRSLLKPKGLLLRSSATKQPREGWAEQFAAALTESADEAQYFADWDITNKFDENEW